MNYREDHAVVELDLQSASIKLMPLQLQRMQDSQIVLEAHMSTQVKHAKLVCSVKSNQSNNKCICKLLLIPRLLPNQLRKLLPNLLRKLLPNLQQKLMIKKPTTKKMQKRRMMQTLTGLNIERALNGLQHNKPRMRISKHGDIMLISTQKMVRKRIK